MIDLADTLAVTNGVVMALCYADCPVPAHQPIVVVIPALLLPDPATLNPAHLLTEKGVTRYWRLSKGNKSLCCPSINVYWSPGSNNQPGKKWGACLTRV